MSKRTRIKLAILLVFLSVLGLVSVAGCGQNPETPANNTKSNAKKAETIKIGHVAVLKGTMSSLGIGGQKALEIWKQQVNSKGGILGRPVEVIEYDTGGQVAKAVEIIKKAVQEDKVDFVITTDSSGVIMAETPLGKDLKKVIIHGTGAADNFQNVTTKYTFRVADPATVFGYAAAKLMLEKYPNVTSWAGINPDYEWGHSVWEAFKKQMLKMQPNAKFELELWPKFGEQDFKPYISQLQASKAQGLFTSLWSGDEATFIKQGRIAKLFDKFGVYVDNSTTNIDVAMVLKKEMVNSIGTAYYYFEGKNDSGDNKEFVKQWQEKYGKDDLPSSSAGSTYSAAQFLAAAVTKAGTTDSDNVVQALEGSTVKTIMGDLTMRAWDHQAIRMHLPTGRTAPDQRFPFWTWQDYQEIPIPADLMPESNYKGWKANQ